MPATGGAVAGGIKLVSSLLHYTAAVEKSDELIAFLLSPRHSRPPLSQASLPAHPDALYEFIIEPEQSGFFAVS